MLAHTLLLRTKLFSVILLLSLIPVTFPQSCAAQNPTLSLGDMESLFTKDVLKKVDETEASRTKVAMVKFVVMCQQAHRAIA